MKYQFNKTAMQRLKRELNVRLKALPTLKAKETALRLEVKKAQEKLEKLKAELEQFLSDTEGVSLLWPEFPDLVRIENVDIQNRNIAGVSLPELQAIDFQVRDFSYFAGRGWVAEGVRVVKTLNEINVRIQLTEQTVEILHYARKKTTQKVNLYEKVQIPEYRDALRKIKGFLEDQENLSRAAQKIVKSRHEARQKEEDEQAELQVQEQEEAS
ncbi:MAG: V-type ATP synthase subunit D [Leptospiraceae bacterium]